MVCDSLGVTEETLHDGEVKMRAVIVRFYHHDKGQSLIWEFKQIASTKDSSCYYINLAKIIGPINSHASGHKLITS
jgi:hypothetical protein